MLKRDIPKDQVLTYDDVVLPEGRLVDKLLQEQAVYFATTDEATRDTVLQHLQRTEASV
ncbi:hypothetical protein GCM10028895_01450 [Pontibacter rugosus]